MWEKAAKKDMAGVSPFVTIVVCMEQREQLSLLYPFAISGLWQETKRFSLSVSQIANFADHTKQCRWVTFYRKMHRGTLNPLNEL